MPLRKFVTSEPNSSITELPKQGVTKEDFIADFKQYYVHLLGRDQECCSPFYASEALSMVVRDRLMENWKQTHQAYKDADCKRAVYLSIEYMPGRTLSNAMLNMGITDTITQAMYDLGIRIEELIECEMDAGLGNGGLGRLAACFIDSCATMQLPVIAYGLRYEYGIFTQTIVNGEQVEKPDHWLRHGNVWEIERLEYAHHIKFGGYTETHLDKRGHQRTVWKGAKEVLAVPFDTPIPGYHNGTVNSLRLWKAVATEEFDLDDFNAGDYPEAIASKTAAENITMVLYPNDSNENGKELRLQQQYFLASASLQDVLAHWVGIHGEDFSKFAEKRCFQLNDTHPSISIAELMRLLVDIHHLPWDDAWNITKNTMAYTNHTLLPESLEKWSVSLMQRLLPRIMEIIYEINARFMIDVSLHWPAENERMRRMSIIEEGDVPLVRMAYLAIAGSFSVNGVSELHSDLLKKRMFSDFYALWPNKFNSKTNGISPRRWLAVCNPGLTTLITETIGTDWITDLSALQKLKPYAEHAEFRKRWHTVKQQAKQRLIDFKQQYHEGHLAMNIDALFDIQVKRIHEYKRQVLNVLHVIYLYDRIKQGHTQDWVPRCVLIGGKAAPGYRMAKKIIKLINNVATVIKLDPDMGDKLALLFLPDYRVSAMEIICSGADLSEQISTAGSEAAGTGNMKLMLNGAMTIGTLDGANIEIREEVGEDNFFLFGMTEHQIDELRAHYDPVSIINQDEDLKRVMHLLEAGHFNQFEPGIFDDIINSLKSPNDPWFTIADFRSYVEAQKRVENAYRDQELWTKMSILNCASSGKFSSDRSISEYNRDIWRLTSQPVNNS